MLTKIFEVIGPGSLLYAIKCVTSVSRDVNRRQNARSSHPVGVSVEKKVVCCLRESCLWLIVPGKFCTVPQASLYQQYKKNLELLYMKCITFLLRNYGCTVSWIVQYGHVTDHCCDEVIGFANSTTVTDLIT